MCLSLVIVLAPFTVITRWTESTLLSTPGFLTALGSLPRTPEVQAQFATQLGGPLATAAAKLPEPIPTLVREGTDAAVAALMNSDAFDTLWRSSLRAAHTQFLLLLRHDSETLVLTGSALQVDVPVTTVLLLQTAGLPRSLERILPATIPATITILTNTALRQASTAVRLTDLLSTALPRTVLVLAALGLSASSRRRRAALTAVSAVALTASLFAVAVILLADAAPRPAILAAVTTDLTRPLIHQLVLAAAAAAAAAVTLGAAAALRARSHPGTAPATRPDGHRA